MFNFHTYCIDDVPCLLNADYRHLEMSYPERVHLSVGIHPWQVEDDWREKMSLVRAVASENRVWAIGECGLDKARGAALSVQREAFCAHIALAEMVQKPLVIHCVRAFDELLALRRELETICKRQGREPQPWVIHGFRGNPEQAKQIMAKGFLLSFGHYYNLETLRFVFTSNRPFFLETDDHSLSVCQIYEQVAHHLDVDVAHLENLCDPCQTIFRPMIS